MGKSTYQVEKLEFAVAKAGPQKCFIFLKSKWWNWISLNEPNNKVTETNYMEELIHCSEFELKKFIYCSLFDIYLIALT